ncbi:DUF1800 family protein [Solicola sp. PLA-1-18]|uniref:DUF1800 family protein n=1 Tax=Solicola sp. PLA-1-18 TaxID=3380532 RepID=UPI003B7B673D
MTFVRSLSRLAQAKPRKKRRKKPKAKKKPKKKKVVAKPTPKPTPKPVPRPAPYVPPAVLAAADQHLVARFTFGHTPQLAAAVTAAGGGRAWFARQLTLTSDPAVARVDAQAWWPSIAKAAPEQWKDHQAGRRMTYQNGGDLVRLSLVRKILAEHQVLEVMADFWLNHLYVPAGEDRSGPWRRDYEDLVRRHALGNVADLVAAAVVHPAMTGFLTNYSNTRFGLDENLGREVLELHTVGRLAGYTEDDVKTSARILTGFKLDAFRTFEASYRPSDHYTGRVSVLGFEHANTDPDGRAVTDAYLRHLALHPSTAQRIARKLCVRFVSDDPSAAVVAAVRAAYTSSRGDVRACLRALVAHPDFWASAGRKVRNATEDVVASARAVGAVPTRPGAEGQTFGTHLIWMTQGVGMRPYSWPRPDGEPSNGSAWSGPTRWLRSWNGRFLMSQDGWRSTDVTRRTAAASLPTVWPRTLAEVTDHVSRVSLGAVATATEKAAVATALGKPQTTSYRTAASVDAQTLAMVRGVLMNSPRHLMR